MSNLTNKKTELIKDITKFRNEYFNKVQSWGRTDADKWWNVQISQALDSIALAAREEVFSEVHNKWGKIGVESKGDRDYFYDKMINLSDEIGSEIYNLRSHLKEKHK